MRQGAWGALAAVVAAVVGCGGLARAHDSRTQGPLEAIKRRGAFRVAIVPATATLRLSGSGRLPPGWRVAEQHDAALQAPALLARIFPTRYYDMVPPSETERALRNLGANPAGLYRPDLGARKPAPRFVRMGGASLELADSPQVLRLTPDLFAPYTYRRSKLALGTGLVTASVEGVAAPDPDAVTRLAKELNADALLFCQVDALTETVNFRFSAATTLIALDASINAGRNPGGGFVPGGLVLYPFVGVGVRPPFPGAGAMGGRDWETRITVHTLLVSGWNGRVLRAATTVGRESDAIDLYGDPYLLVMTAPGGQGFPESGRPTSLAPPRPTLTRLLLIEALDRAARSLGSWLLGGPALATLLAEARPR